MRTLLLLLPLSLLVNCYPCDPAHAQPSGYPPGTYPPGAPPPPPPGYQPQPGSDARNPAYSQENCGTPDEPKPCPPMPRRPLQYYPANRQ